MWEYDDDEDDLRHRKLGLDVVPHGGRRSCQEPLDLALRLQYDSRRCLDLPERPLPVGHVWSVVVAGFGVSRCGSLRLA